MERVAARLLAEVGTRETPVNITPYAAALDAVEHPRMGRQGSPWCGTFIDWGCRMEGVGLAISNFWTPGAATWYHDHNQWSHLAPRRGDFAFLNRTGDHGHVGFVLDVQGATVKTVEGNTTTSAAGSQANGGEVAVKTRMVPWWAGGFGQPDYGLVVPSLVPPAVPAQVEEGDVQRFVRRKDRQAVYLGDRIAKRWMKDPATYQRQRAAMAFDGIAAAFLEEHVVDTQDDLDLWGVTLGEDPGDV